ncbi:cation:proton antiporter [bacterium]|nr:cation:proton antiporter [bacterium]
MNSLIFERVAAWFFPILQAFAIYILFRGHNAAGGGFIAGLISSSAYVLYAIAFDPSKAMKKFKLNPLMFAGVGLFVAFISGFYPTVSELPFFTGIWGEVFGLAIGTPVFFDIGVFMVVIGVTLSIVMNLLRHE